MPPLYGFTLLREQWINELNSQARLYRHLKTGAELLSLENSDENKVFGITFRTPPRDSSGVAHIMEHSVLCGSRKYPVKEPFVELMKGSLNTFLNALTYPDKTVYPVASQNLQDFYNLVDVYLDAVFYPLLSPYTLDQEGWHYELEAEDAPLGYKGVVFNEMKGAYSSPDSVLDEYSQHQVYPDTIYAHDSGGDPACIPTLTYAAFKDFHRRFYHPSNARIFFWGDDPAEERLRRLDEYLNAFDALAVDSHIPLQPHFDAPRRVELPYEAGAGEEARTLVSVNWLLPEGDEAELALALVILDHILTGTPAAPLRKALIDSGLGEDLVGRGLENGARQMFFSTGLKGVAETECEQVETLVLDTLRQLVQDGLDAQTIAASLNTIEFNLRENNTGPYPRGLVVMLRSLSTWLYEHDPLAPLTFEAPLQAIQARVAAGERYFEELIRQYLLDNPHRATVILKPDPQLGERRAAAEQERLQAARRAMTSAELQAILANTRELKRRQETADRPEDLAKIPALTRADLEPQVRRIPSEHSSLSGAQVLFHDLPTSGIVYLDLGFDLHCLPQSWLPYLPIFGRALLETGTIQQDFVQLIQRIGSTTGGIYPTLNISAVRGQKEASAWLFLRGKAMLHQTGDLLSILDEVLRGVRLDNRERIRQMALEEKAAYSSSLTNAGHRFTNTRLRSNFSEAGWASEQTGGISQLFFLRRLVDQIDQEWPRVQERLEEIRQALLNRQAMLCNVTVDAQGWQAFQPQLAAFLAALPAADTRPAVWVQPPMSVNEGLVLPAQINFVGKGVDLYRAGYQMSGSVLVIGNHLTGSWLWDRVRVQGGAYGAFAPFDHLTGVLTFLSYRDPNLMETLSVYDQTGAYLRRLELDEAELTKLIIGVIGDLDAYQLPDAKGYTAMLRHLNGVTDELRQHWRDEVLATRVDDFHAFGELIETQLAQGTVVVLGAAEAIEAASAAQPGWLEVQRLL